MKDQIKVVRDALRQFNRRAGVLKSDPYGVGLSLSQCSALIDIDRIENLKANDLVALLHLEKSSVSRLIAVLKNKKLIQIVNDPLDKRSKILGLTKRGEHVVEKINAISNQSVKEALEAFDQTDKIMIASAFEKLASSLPS